MLDSDDHTEASGRPQSGQEKTGVWNTITGRKRGQSGQGSELGAIPKRETTPKPSPLQAETPAKLETVQPEVAKSEAVQPEATAKPEVQDKAQPKAQQNGEVANAPKAENTQAPEVRIEKADS